MTYSTPYLVWLGGFVCLLWTLDYWSIGRRSNLTTPASSITASSNFILRGLLFIISISGLVFISYAMMGPRKAQNYLPGTIKVNDIMFVMDVSRSMLAMDLPPNRLEVSKRQVSNFIKMRPTDRIGVIIFSEKVFTLLPLTTDPDLVTKSIADIEIGPLGAGTNIGDALALGVARLETSAAENKIIILLTDGVSNVDSIHPLDAAKLAKKYGVKVYTIGVGGDKDAKIPVKSNMFGTQYMSTPGGGIDFDTLLKISNETGGKMYKAVNEDDLKKVFDEIESLEKIEVKANTQVVYEELYHKYLVIGVLMFLLIEILRKGPLKDYA